jgi:hypothetical protein
MIRLQNVESDCLHLEGLHAAAPNRVQEYIRAYAVLLSAEFQGFCRELHDECTDKLVASVKPVPLQDVLRSQCIYGRKLDTSNPNEGNLGADFNRFQLKFWDEVTALDPTHQTRRGRLSTLMNVWRNAIAHHDYDPAKLGGATDLTIVQVTDWRTDCDALATSFDTVMRIHLQAVTGALSWPP